MDLCANIITKKSKIANAEPAKFEISHFFKQTLRNCIYCCRNDMFLLLTCRLAESQHETLLRRV